MQETNLLNKFYQPLSLNIASFTRQFILSKDSDLIPDGWNRYEKGQWCLGTSELPVLDIENTAGKDIGWCIGYPVNHKEPWTKKIVIDCQDSESINMIGVENFYIDTGGRYVLVLLTQKEEKFFLDPFGSLAAVFSTSEPIVASTPTLLGEKYSWDREIILSLNMPESGRWFPSGLTPKKRVRRLLPNHYLDLNDWSVVRHWPGASSDLAVDQDIDKNVSIITSCLKNMIGTIAERYPIQMTLTAGKDTRILLACARDYLSNIHLFTQSRDDETVDMHIASKLAEKLGLDHSFIPIRTATDDEMFRWLYLTGHAVGGVIWKIHKTMESFDPQRVVINGIFGEIGRARFWNKNDFLDMKISAVNLLKRDNLPYENRVLSEMDKWLSELSEYNTFGVLDLFTLEQKKGCWASPMFYANTFSRFAICPFNHRRIIQAMMKLPYEYRFRQQLPEDICLKLWPELLELPFNEFTGLKNYINKTKTYVTKTKRSSVNSAKRFAKGIAKKLLPREI